MFLNPFAFEVLLIVSDHPRERGIANNDVTSFLPSQEDWGPDCDLHWPKINDNVLHRFERNGYPIPNYKQEVWFHAGKIALDPDNHAILKYDVLPATLSSEISGRDMEAMKRLDLRIGRKDFRARMPSKILTKDKNKPQKVKPIHTISAIGMGTTRFLKENGLVSWTEREGGGNIRQYLLKRMPQTSIKPNSTQRMSLPSLFEQENSRSPNRGQHLKRAGGSALSNETRSRREKKDKERLEKLQNDDIEAKRQFKKKVSRKRKRDNIWSDIEKESQQSKRMRDETNARVSRSNTNWALPSQVPLSSDPPLRPRAYPATQYHQNLDVNVVTKSF